MANDSKKAAYRFVILLGFVSLFADVTYEGARSITGPYLAVLGASATVVGFFAGLGELIGYGLRLVAGYVTDKTKRYWTITFIGYTVNLLAVPAMAFAGRWEFAVCLMVAERMGKAIRTPARDAILSHATREIGVGWGFGLHEALDQIGAMSGPLIVSVILLFKGNYQAAFAFLAIPAVLALGILFRAMTLYPNPTQAKAVSVPWEGKGFPKTYWLYLAAVALIAAGYADFPLIAYHFKKIHLASDQWIPVFYAVAMGVDALAALVFGRLFDKAGIPILILSSIFSALFAPCVFRGGFGLALCGMVFWGIGMGAQESIMRAAIATMVPLEKRGTAYGIFNTGYGLCWFLGSAVMGMLYDKSLTLLIVFSVALQIGAIPLLAAVGKKVQ
ncbi:MAG: MFS transporter [Candidatus Omnitrophica bacterium]|nr:MFS transporter [Candidatus Omnitrophota bacterium]MDD5670208.1 MFS transporter [Candidatus Omnitrophota bacterium]